MRAADLGVCGPLARSAADLDLVLSILAGPEGDMATGHQLALPGPRHEHLRDYRVLVVDEHPLVPLAMTFGPQFADVPNGWPGLGPRWPGPASWSRI